MKISRIKLTIACLVVTTPTFASDFNIPFVNAAGLGTAYADWATATSDASSAYTNPAGLTSLKHQQLVFAALGIQGSTRFTGSSLTPPYPFPAAVAQTGSASSRIGAFMPSFYYALPVNNRLTFAVSQTVPFALGSSYAKDSIVRYVSTRSQIVAVDLGPSIGFKVNEQFSLGVGVDAMRLAFTLNNMFGPSVSIPDAEGQNHLSGWGLGWHGGVMYQPLPATRLGLSFNSMVTIHTTGDSEAYASFGTFRTTNQKTNAALPARTQFSVQQDLNRLITVMGTVFYTNWNTFQQVTMKRVMLPGGTTTSVSIPFGYHNTFDYSIGATVKATEKVLLKIGMQFMNTPSNNRDRAVADPIGSAVVLGVGAHYQQSEKLGYDLSFGHSFFATESVNLNSPLTQLTGNNTAQTSVLGLQVTWNMV
jgi:long-chain fatty acid transport protein